MTRTADTREERRRGENGDQRADRVDSAVTAPVALPCPSACTHTAVPRPCPCPCPRSTPCRCGRLALRRPFLTRSAVRSMCCRQRVASTEFLKTTMSDARSTRNRIRVVRRERRITLLGLSFCAPTDKPTAHEQTHTTHALTPSACSPSSASDLVRVDLQWPHECLPPRTASPSVCASD